jgi:N-acetyl-anhydromuramyl-L-alanine amidase AmpD
MDEIIAIQRILKLPVTGVLDEFTEAALRNYQIKNGLPVTGLLDNTTKSKLNLSEDALMHDTDQFSADGIKKYFLPPGQFFAEKTPKWSIFLHHTAGWNNPFRVVDYWANDPAGKIGTHFVIGGPHPTQGESEYDGQIVQCMDLDYYAWHLTIGNTDVHRNSIGIELCNFGWLTKGGYTDLKTKKWVAGKPDLFYSYTGLVIPANQVIDLEFKFRDYRYYHTYSMRQLESLRHLLEYLSNRFSIDIYSGMISRLKNREHPGKVFEYWDDARIGKVRGLFCHSNVVKSGKWDLSPQPNLIDMLLTL